MNTMTKLSGDGRAGNLTFEWIGTGIVTFALEDVGDQVLLTITQRELPEGDMRSKIRAGWHTHVEILDAALRGKPRPDFGTRWTELDRSYSTRASD